MHLPNVVLCWLLGHDGYLVPDFRARQRGGLQARDVRDTGKLTLADTEVFLEKVLSCPRDSRPAPGPISCRLWDPNKSKLWSLTNRGKFKGFGASLEGKEPSRSSCSVLRTVIL